MRGVQIGATVNHYFSAPDFFKSAVISHFEDKYAVYRFAAPAIEHELYGDGTAVQFWVIPTKVGEYKITSGAVPETYLNKARFKVVASESELSNPANLKSEAVTGACPAPGTTAGTTAVEKAGSSPGLVAGSLVAAIGITVVMLVW
jgi:hypothetical protein